MRGPYRAKVDTAASGDNTIVAAVAGSSIVVNQYTLVAGGAVNVTWKSGSTALTGAMPIAASGGGIAAGADPLGCLETAAGAALVLNLSGAVQVSGHVTYQLNP